MERNPNTKSARPSEIMRSQREVIRQQDEIIDVLKSALAAAGVNTIPTHDGWMTGLTRQERALMGVLFARYPHAMPRDTLLDFLPGQDHARERQLQVVDVIVHKVRKKLGVHAVETERGRGFRLGKVFYDALPKQHLEEAGRLAVRPEHPSFL
jgi:DNA-binding response OmpR family regulator